MRTCRFGPPHPRFRSSTAPVYSDGDGCRAYAVRRADRPRRARPVGLRPRAEAVRAARPGHRRSTPERRGADHQTRRYSGLHARDDDAVQGDRPRLLDRAGRRATSSTPRWSSTGRGVPKLSHDHADGPRAAPTPMRRARSWTSWSPATSSPTTRCRIDTGAARRLSDWRGQAVAVTFVYTRCPMPDFCPLMDRQFAAVQRAMLADPALRDRAH